jgi:hypothetical protein
VACGLAWCPLGCLAGPRVGLATPGSDRLGAQQAAYSTWERTTSEAFCPKIFPIFRFLYWESASPSVGDVNTHVFTCEVTGCTDGYVLE